MTKATTRQPAAEPEQPADARIEDGTDDGADLLHVAAPATDPNAAVWLELAKPFPVEWIEKLPKQLRKGDDDRGKCEPGNRYSADGYGCGGYHARSVHLDYVGHAGITMRLNAVVGPGGWNLEPISLREDGTPFVPKGGEFWGRLTILGVSKVDLAANYYSTQEAWGDLLRRCAMRFGIGTYLWAKSEYAAELATYKEPAPGEAPADRAQEAANRLASQVWPEATLAAVEAHANDNGYLAELVAFKGATMPLSSALAMSRAALQDQQAAATAQQAPADAIEAAQEPATAPQTAEEAPAATTTGETPQDAAYDLARESLIASDPEVLRTYYRAADANLRAIDVLPVLGDDDLAALEAPVGVQAIPLGSLLIQAAKYVDANGRAIRDLGEPDGWTPAEQTTGPDPWADDIAAGRANQPLP